jgi:phosphatidylinositol alpha-mannosyltransferase
MKIALVSPYDWSYPGGVGQHIQHLAGYLRERGHEAHILTAASEPVNDPQVHVIGNAFPLAINGSVARPGVPTLRWTPTDDILSPERYDLVHLHEPLVSPLSMACALFARAYGIPCVGTFHAAASQSARWLYECARPVIGPVFAALDECIAVSHVALATIRQIFPVEYHIIPNGVSVERFASARRAADRKAELSHSVRYHEYAPTVRFLGRLEPRKGVDVLLEAIPLVREMASAAGDPPPRFMIAGEGPDRERYERSICDQDNVIFTGAISEDQKPAYLAEADVFCAPAIGAESQGIVLLEAMAAGATVVASDIPGYATVVEHEQTGLLVPPRDPQRLAVELHRALHDPMLRARLAIPAQVAVRRYDWKQVGCEIEAIYAAATAHRAAKVAQNRVETYPFAIEAQ